MIYITGDTHGNFNHIYDFCERMKTTKDDVLIILGDAGINYYVTPLENPSEDIIYKDENSKWLKEKLATLPITLFCIHGNHEARPETIENYAMKEWNNGNVYVQEEYPNLLFAKDGETYTIGNKKTLVLGGAYSVDKYYRMQLQKCRQKNAMWFSDEQMKPMVRERIEKQIEEDSKFDIILSHTTPYQYRPTEAFLDGLDQSTVDNSMEIWLQEIEEEISYEHWYAGHYHVNKKVDKMILLFNDILEFN